MKSSKKQIKNMTRASEENLSGITNGSHNVNI
jgi:hypothetical protein